MIEIQPKAPNTEDSLILPSSNEAIGDGGGGMVEVPQQLLEHFNIKPEDTLSTQETQRLQDIYVMAKEVYPEGDTGAILRFISAVERANPTYAASEQDRLFNIYKNFKLGKVYDN